jgi:hypothetical protein
VKSLEGIFWVGRLHGARKIRRMSFQKKPSLFCSCLLIHGASVCLLLRQTRALRCNVASWNPQIVNNDEDAGLQTVIIGDIFSVFMICIYYNWLWSRLGRIWRNTVGGIMTVSFEDCHWNDYTSVACALYKIWNPLKITFIILKISAILGIYHWIARYCSCDGIELCASIRSSGLLKNGFLNFLH